MDSLADLVGLRDCIDLYDKHSKFKQLKQRWVFIILYQYSMKHHDLVIPCLKSEPFVQQLDMCRRKVEAVKVNWNL